MTSVVCCISALSRGEGPVIAAPMHVCISEVRLMCSGSLIDGDYLFMNLRLKV